MPFLIEGAHLFALSGFVVGGLVGVSGVGGGALMTPILVMLFGIHPVTAVGTDLLYAAITKSVGTVVHGRNRTVDWRVTSLLAAGSVPVTLLVLFFFAGRGHGDPAIGALVKTAIGCALLLTATLLVLRPTLLAWLERRRRTRPAPDPRWRDGLTILVGTFLGGLVSMTSVGAGAVGVTALFALYPQMSTHRIVASDIAHAVPLTFLSGVGYWYYGGVDFGMLGALLLGSVPGILIGSWISPKVPDRVLRPLLAIVLAIVGYRLVVP